MVKNTESVKYLIIGNSAGGIGAAEAIRQTDKAGTMTIISDEPYPVYSRPMISNYLAEECPLERMLFRPPDFYEKNNIRTLLGVKATAIDVQKHTVQLEDKRTINWEKLLLATGGSPIVPPIKGIDRSAVFTFTNLDDAKKIARFLNRFRNRVGRAVVIGGGLIGVSAAEALVKRGIKVTIVEMKERLLNIILDEEASAVEAEALKKDGVNIITGHTVTEISSYWEDAIIGVTLDDGTPLPSGLVIVAIGVRPRTELAAAGGIKLNRGIVVDAHMATSSPDVYTCGDAAEAYDFVYGECRLTPIWPNAYVGGRVAGRNMAGITTTYPGGTSMNSLKYFGLNAVSAGIVNPPDGSYETLANKDAVNYRKVILKNGVIVGMVFVGSIEKSGIILNLMKERVDVTGFKQSLVADDFGLASLPRELWRFRAAAPRPDLIPVT